MPQDLNSYQVYISRELAKTSGQFKDIVHTRELWLAVNVEYVLQVTLDWEIEMLLDGFIYIEDDLLLSRIQGDNKAYGINIPLKLTPKGMEYLSSWSADKIINRNLNDKVLRLQKMVDEKKKKKNQPATTIANPSQKDQHKITIAALGIMYVYIKENGGQGVTINNKNTLAAKHGYISKNSGKQLYDEYNKFNNGELVSDRVHLSRLLSIRSLIKSEYINALPSLERDIAKYQKRMQK